MQIHGLNKTTLLDYPGLVASTIFTGCCNFRCPFCQNADLVLDPSSQPVISEEEVFEFLGKRKGIVKGVCITGGEPTLQSDLKDFIIKLKEQDLLVKLDTNGYRPDVVKCLVENKLVDYIAMDIKSSPSRYSEAAGIDIDIRKIKESIDIIMSSVPDYEFRTTVVRELHDEETFEEIGQLIKGAKKYYLQCFKDSERVIKKGLTAYSREELEKLVKKVNIFVDFVDIRGIE